MKRKIFIRIIKLKNQFSFMEKPGFLTKKCQPIKICHFVFQIGTINLNLKSNNSYI